MFRILYNAFEVQYMNRRDKILKIIQNSHKPISASSLASELGVSRQVIVGDVALIRASGTNIIATPRGYIVDHDDSHDQYVIAVNHDASHVQDELYTIVDLGGSIIDVIIEHPVYGQLTGELHISSRYDVDQFLLRIHESQAYPLSQLTHGLHLHTIYCPDSNVYSRIIDALDQKGYLFKK